MPLLFDRIRIQNKLVELAKAGPFYPVSYANGDSSANTAQTVAPSSAIANEVSASFSQAVRNRMRDMRERTEWQFQLLIGFDQEVVCEAFERALTDNPVKLLRDPNNSLKQQVTLELRDAEYRHPVQQEGRTGTFVTYTFEARLSPL